MARKATDINQLIEHTTAAPVSMTQVRVARLRCAEKAEDADDLRMLLSMCGIGSQLEVRLDDASVAAAG